MSAILITGGEGQLGKALQATVTNHLLLTPLFCNKSMLDIRNLAQIESYIRANSIDYIINCAAYTNVSLAEQEITACFEVNSVGVGHLAALAAKYGIILFHISTDYVFGNSQGRPLKPNDPTNPLNVYGCSKLAGEQQVAAYKNNFYIIRTAWLYSPEGNNFFTKIVGLAQQGGDIQIVDDQVGSPTYVYDLATAIWKMVEKVRAKGAKNYPSGIYHYTNEGVASWYDFAYAILKNLPGRYALTPVSSDSSDLKRPYYSVLDKSSFRSIFQIQIPYWQERVAICFTKWRT